MPANGALEGSTSPRSTRPATDLPQPEGPRRTSIGYGPLGLSAETSHVRQRSQSAPLRFSAPRSRSSASAEPSDLGAGMAMLVAEFSKLGPRLPLWTWYPAGVISTYSPAGLDRSI